MYTQLALDLQLARRRAGLTQAECATLLNISRGQMRRIEQGAVEPKLREIVALSLLYGRSFEAFFADVMQEAKATLQAGLEELPEGPGTTAET